jgi:uncharacterized protein YhjY with autotransporter beta-barrel domain
MDFRSEFAKAAAPERATGGQNGTAVLRETSLADARSQICRSVLSRPCLPAVGAFLLTQTLAGGVWAQSCIPNVTPQPPSPPPAVTVPNYNGQTLGPSPANSFYINLTGAPGFDGGDTQDNCQNGIPGGPGQTAASTGLLVQNVTVNGPSTTMAPNFLTVMMPIWANGGYGGTGGRADYASVPDTYGGQGGVGANGAGLTGSVALVTLNAGDPTKTGAVGRGLWITTNGGNGGNGGGALRTLYPNEAGQGGAGGNGGSMLLPLGLTVIEAPNGGLPGIALLVDSTGGDGGFGGSADDNIASSYGGAGGAGGNGGTVTAIILPTSVVLGKQYAAFGAANGGRGGDGGQAGQTGGESDGGDAGAGGAGGTINHDFAGSATVTGPAYPGEPLTGVGAVSLGGRGGDGGISQGGLGGTAGNGGNGGAGGNATLNLDGSVTVNRTDTGAFLGGYGLKVVSAGGDGGLGNRSAANYGYGGNGGTAAGGGTAQLQIGSPDDQLPSTVTTNGAHVHGAVVQSIGGGGGGGGNAEFFGTGGVGANGGNGGAAIVTPGQGQVVTNGDSSKALIAQSIGGNGGVGGNSTDIVTGGAQLAVGGNSGNGAAAGNVTVGLAQGDILATMSTKGGGGILAQSVGGTGGLAGSASIQGSGIFTLAIGGTAGVGGNGGTVTVNNPALINTHGDHAPGVKGQSVGGGGGIGGVAVTISGSAVPTLAAAVGGSGAQGGTGGGVTIVNDGQIITFGADSDGIKAQSVGGGGGSGGSATATAIDVAPTEDFPAVSVSYAAGGAGGAGNIGGTVSVTNSNNVLTAGHAAYGIRAQSVGGGGGDAGDATAASYSGATSSDNIAINFSVALGGTGGTGGSGGKVTASNSGFLYTTGQDAFGILGHSVGGGGGGGGVGDTSSTAVVNDTSISISYGVGGKGGVGGDGGEVDLINVAGGMIGTRGDGADGVFAQSVGGGGGVAGGGVAASSGGLLSIALGVGGDGGAGGAGGTVTARNDGLIATRGTDSLGLAAQSVGGGGGRGGKAGATAGGADDDLPLFVQQEIEAGLNVNAQVSQPLDGVWQFQDRVNGDVGTIENLVDSVVEKPDAPSDPTTGDDPSKDAISESIYMSLSVGGKGGAGGAGGSVGLTNTGSIVTQGAHADAVIGQSVGAGGGIGGASTASTTGSDDTEPNLGITLGGGGGASGNGGAVTVKHYGSIGTLGNGAYGIVGQSVGGGGGRGGASADSSTSAFSFAVDFGGSGGANGAGGAVEVDLCDSGATCAGGSVTTTGKHAVGILAQSVGGGGGLLRTMATHQQGDQSGSTTDDDPDTHNIYLDMGVDGQSGSTGNGGTVTVNLDSGTSVTTSGRNAHGIVANSTGGGGGAVGGGLVNLIQRAATSGASSGDGGPVTVSLDGARIAVSGKNSVGLWASSIGGGGQVIMTDGKAGMVSPGITGQSGSGNDIAVNLTGTTITATGGGHAILAHSLAGGGVSYLDGGGTGPTVNGTAWQSLAGNLTLAGTGQSGNVDLTLTNSTVSASGADAAAIMAASMSGSSQTSSKGIQLTVNGGTVSNASTALATIQMLSNAAPSTVTNSGTIQNTATGGYALFSQTSVSQPFTVKNTGTITGNIGGASTGAALGDASPAIDNQPGGLLAPYDRIDIGGTGWLRNAGVIEVGAARRIRDTTLDGHLVQTGSGRLHFDLDASAGQVDHLAVTGTATLAGKFAFIPVTLLPGSHEVLSAAGGVTLVPSEPATTHVYTYVPTATATTVNLSTAANFRAAGAETGDRQAVAQHLQQIWDAGGTGFATGFAALAGIQDAGTYSQALDSMAGQTVAAIGYARIIGSQAMAQSTYSCPEFVDGSVVQRQDSCVWLRVRGTWLDRDADGDDPAFDFDAGTTTLGGQYRLDDGLFLGGALGYETSNLNANSAGTSVDGDAVVAAVSLKREVGLWTFTGAADLGWGWYDTTRQVTVGSLTQTAEASPDAFNAGIHGRAAYQIPKGDWYMEPALEVDISYVQLDGYTETGAGNLNLTVDESDTVVLTGTPWLKLGRRVDLKDATILDAYVAAGLSLSTGQDLDTTASFAGAPAGTGSFTTTLNNPDVIARISAGVRIFSSEHWDTRLQYDGAFADGQTQNGGQIRIAYYF